MMKILATSICLACLSATNVSALEGVELIYKEQEPGIDPYFVRFSVTEDRLRIDDLNDDSGFIIYDLSENTVFSVSHFDSSILIIDGDTQDAEADKPASRTEVKELVDAPAIAGKKVRDFRLMSEEDGELCANIHYVPDTLGRIGEIMHSYQAVIAANQRRTIHQMPEDISSPCIVLDMGYNEGEYHKDGLVISEWHITGKQRYLEDYKDREFDMSLFQLPEEYRRFSVGQ